MNGGKEKREQSACFCYIFGFGSLTSTDTHKAWLRGDDASSQAPTPLKGCLVRVKKRFGYKRSWNFRSTTGFTALGVSRATEAAVDINGVMFRVPCDQLSDFDRREVGYDRVQLKRSDYELLPSDHYGSAMKDPSLYFNSIGSNESVFVYIPQDEACVSPDEQHPLLQSYVDTVMQGMLEWGGEGMAEEFVATTDGWSTFFLNDTPNSRRPWLYRKQYVIIDRILSFMSHTHYSDRKHPEEFASSLTRQFRGLWNVPRRNQQFVGRDKQIAAVHANLLEQRDTSIARLVVAAMGGVGKTQLIAEYCYRFLNFYGLIVWINSQGAENLVASYRQLMADTTDIDVKDKETEEILTEVKARLFRSKVNWLLVFDNLEDLSLLDKFLPHGTSTIGHVVVTTRIVEPGDHLLVLDCLSDEESLELLRRSAGAQNINGADNLQAARDLAASLGHLPLAMGVAAAYMNRCDTTCAEYLSRYRDSGTGTLSHRGLLKDYPLGVAQSLALSSTAIKNESIAAWDVLRLLSWLGPDYITKSLIRSLLNAKNTRPHIVAKGGIATEMGLSLKAGIAASFACISIIVVRHSVSRQRSAIRQGLVCTTILAATAAASWCVKKRKNADDWMTASTKTYVPPTSPLTHHESSNFSSFEFEQTDQIWNILKSYSILVIKGGQGSMHRLLQEALRAEQGEEEQRYNLDICVHTMIQLWTFSSRDVETWSESEKLLEHVKHVVQHVSKSTQCSDSTVGLHASRLSTEAAVFGAMVLNQFQECHKSLEVSLTMLSRCGKGRSKAHMQAQSEALHQLGRNFRYQGKFDKSEEALEEALAIRKELARNNDVFSRQHLADTLYEFGVLEIKKHQLESAAVYLEQALSLRQDLNYQADPSGEVGATYHQLAAVEMQKKPPNLPKAETLLLKALKLRMQVGQRAATLKQLARVCLRQGQTDRAGTYLAQALELYLELYGENAAHINVAAVKFQLGALASQREDFDEAWINFSECLRIRKRVYAYAGRDETGDYPAHLDVSAVLHELACVAFAQSRYDVADAMLLAEKEILVRLKDSSSQLQRIHQALVTNLTWRKKCVTELGDSERVKQILSERSQLKKMSKQNKVVEKVGEPSELAPNVLLVVEASNARAMVRKLALLVGNNSSGNKKWADLKSQVLASLDSLRDEALRANSDECRELSSASITFRDKVHEAIVLSNVKERKSLMLKACDDLRDALRNQGIVVQDKVGK